LIKLVVVLAICLAGVGLYRGWFSLPKATPDTEANNADKINVNVSVDKDKMKADVKNAKEKVKEEIKELQGKARAKQVK